MRWGRYLILVTTALIWCFAILSFPWLLHNGYMMSSVAISLFFSKLCHQLVERSLGVDGVSFPVCSRCLALYIGMLAGILLFPAFGLFCKFRGQIRLLLYAGIGFTALDIGLDKFKVFSNTFVSRTFTGSLLGLSLGLLLTMATQGMDISWKGRNRDHDH